MNSASKSCAKRNFSKGVSMLVRLCGRETALATSYLPRKVGEGSDLCCFKGICIEISEFMSFS